MEGECPPRATESVYPRRPLVLGPMGLEGQHRAPPSLSSWSRATADSGTRCTEVTGPREDPCQAVQVGLELQGVVKALAVEDCTDRAAAEPTRLLERDSELSDLGGSRTARLCNHHSQLYMMSCQGRKCSVLSCYGAVHGAHRGAPLCRKHLAETARSLSPASTGPRTPRSQTKDSFDLTSTLRTSHAKVEPRAVRFESAAEAVGVPPRSREPSPPRPCAPKPPPAYLEPLTPLEQRVAVPAGEPVLG